MPPYSAALIAYLTAIPLAVQQIDTSFRSSRIPRVFFVGTITVVWTGLGALIGASLDNWRAVPQ